MEGRTTVAIEGDERFALVGDTHPDDLVRSHGLAREQFTGGSEQVRPDLAGIVFDPARLRIMLPMLASSLVDDSTLLVEKYDLGGRRTLVDREKERHVRSA